MSQEYTGAIIIAAIMAISTALHITLDNQTVQNVVVGLIAIWVAIRRHQQGDITLAGVRKA